MEEFTNWLINYKTPKPRSIHQGFSNWKMKDDI